MPELDIKYFIAFAGFVLPGAISMYVYGLKIPQKEHKLKDRILEAVCFSLLNFIVLIALVQFLFLPNFIFDHPIYSWIIVFGSFVLAPIVWPILLVLLLRYAESHGWIGVRASTAWDDFFARLQRGCWVQVVLNDGERVGGKFFEVSYASAFPDPGHIYIEELWKISDDGAFVTEVDGAPGIILRPTDYRYILVFTGDDK